MTKSELINQLMARVKPQSSEKVTDAVNLMLDQITKTLNDRGRIEIRGFGSFKTNEWGARYARNPVTGESWRTEPTVAVHFKPGKELRDRVNFGKDSEEEE